MFLKVKAASLSHTDAHPCKILDYFNQSYKLKEEQENKKLLNS